MNKIIKFLILATLIGRQSLSIVHAQNFSLFENENGKTVGIEMNGNFSASNEILDLIDLDGFDKLVIVAHSDDHVLWGGRYMIEDDYFVVVCANIAFNVEWSESDPKAYFHHVHANVLNNRYIALNLAGNNLDALRGSDVQRERLYNDLKTIIEYKQWNQILTHNRIGDGNNSCDHMTVNKVVTRIAYELDIIGKLWYFSIHYDLSKNVEITLDEEGVAKVLEVLGYFASYLMDRWPPYLKYQNMYSASSIIHEWKPHLQWWDRYFYLDYCTECYNLAKYCSPVSAYTENYGYIYGPCKRYLPESINFDAVTYNSYFDIPSMDLALAGKGKMEDLQYRFKNNAAFEITARFTQAPLYNFLSLSTTKEYFSVRPKNSLPAGTYTDVLILSAKVNGYLFSFETLLNFTVNKADPEYIVPVNLTATFGDLLSSVTLPTGWSWDSPTDLVGAVGERTNKATFTPDDVENYNMMMGIDVKITVEKADPEYIIPVGLIATFGGLLSSVTLPTGWSWDSPTDLVGSVGERIHKATFTPDDIENYNVMTGVDVMITVEKADPEYIVPVNLTATFGDLLSSVTLPTGWSWDSPTDLVGAVGERTHKATFTPDDIENYNMMMDIDVKITVEKADPEYIIPVGLIATFGGLLSSVTLPAGWTWDSPSDLVGSAGERIHKATFTPDDIENYNVVPGVDVTVTVSPITYSPEYVVTPLKACTHNGLLHITGISIGEMLSIYSVTGAVLYHGVATSENMDISLRAQGVYIVRSGNNMLKVVFLIQ